MSRSVRPTVLIVCTANVCRSPYAEYLIEDVFLDDPALSRVQVGSAGIRPVRGAHLCGMVEERHSRTERWEEFVGQHSPTRATPSRVAQARLILTASRSNRAAVALIDPGARSRTFTLREAAWLGSDYVRDPSLEGPAAVSAFADYLDSQRGVKPPLRAIRTGLLSKPGDPLSIVDGHNLRPADHQRTLKDARLISVGSAQAAAVV
jgi:protein-tyrosine phosphatase